MVVDNVLFKGWVADEEQAPKRLKPLVRKIRDFNEWLMKHEQFSTRFHSVGDGMAVSIKHTDEQCR